MNGHNLKVNDYIRKYLLDSNIEIKNVVDFTEMSNPIWHKCKNIGCSEEWLVSPTIIARRLGRCENKTLCCKICRKKVQIEEIRKRTHKICTTCNIDKVLDDYNDCKNSSDWKYSRCKLCHKEACDLWIEENPEKRKEAIKNHDNTHKERKKEYYQQNKEKIINNSKEYYQENKKELLIKNKIYRETHRAERNAHEQKRLKNDPGYRLLTNLRKRLCKIVKNKTEKTLNLIGCSGKYYAEYNENQFIKGMTWDNIHIDHIIPLDFFNLENTDELKMACHYTNTQPLFGSDNIAKSSMLPDDFNRRIWKGKKKGWIVI